MPSIGKTIFFTNPIVENVTNFSKFKRQKDYINLKNIDNYKSIKSYVWTPYIVSIACVVILLFAIVSVLIYIRNKRSLNNKNLIVNNDFKKFDFLNSQERNIKLPNKDSKQVKERKNNWLNLQSINNVLNHLKQPKEINPEIESKDVKINPSNIVIKEIQPVISKKESYYLGGSNTLAFSPQTTGVLSGYHYRNHTHRAKNKGLLESRRGSRTSLTLSLSPSIDSISSTRSPSPLKTDNEQDRYILENNSIYLTIDELKKKVEGDSDILFQEFWSIPMNHPSRYDLSISGMANKNRYKSIIPNEKTRVILPQIDDNYLSSYINANYIRGYKNCEKRFVATQGPMPQTVVDFWRLVWHVKASAIVMLTKLTEKERKKCEYYLPNDIVREESFGNITVSIQNIYFMEGYAVRELIIKFANEILFCTHYWFTSWPDHGSPTPETTTYLLSLLSSLECFKMYNSSSDEIRTNHNTSDSIRPSIVHCSAGLGRTGCFIALCTGCLQLRCESGVDVFGIVSNMRLDRGGMINNNEQYEFLHRALLQYAQHYCVPISVLLPPPLQTESVSKSSETKTDLKK